MPMSIEEAKKYAPIEDIISDIKEERSYQNEKWDSQPDFDDATWVAILTEEVGEVAQALLDARYVGDDIFHLYKELIQVAAVATAWAQKVGKVYG